MRKECVEGRKAYNVDQEVTKERNSQCFFPSLLLAFFRAHVTDCSSFSWLAGHMHLTKSGKARTKLCASQRAVLNDQFLRYLCKACCSQIYQNLHFFIQIMHN